jgi:general secretion pathway protein D
MRNNIIIIISVFVGLIKSVGCDEVVNYEKRVPLINQQIVDLKDELKDKFHLATTLFAKEAATSEYELLITEIKTIKEKIHQAEEQWRQDYKDEVRDIEGGYAFWDQGETTLSSLIMEYGSSDYLYVIPYELGSMKLHLYSSIPIPHESWDEMITLILAHNGVGIKKLTPYLRQLFILKHDPGHIEAISHTAEDLERTPDQSWVFHIFTPLPEQIKATQSFFEKFSDPKQTSIQVVGGKIAVVGTKENIVRLMSLYQSVWESNQGKVIKTIRLSKLQVGEAEKVLRSFFQEANVKMRPSLSPYMGEDLQILPLAHGNQLVLIGNTDMVERGEMVIEDLESQLDEMGEMTVFWYTCKHSDPDDLAQILDKVYLSLTKTGASVDTKDKTKKPQVAEVDATAPKLREVPISTAYQPVLPVTPTMTEPGKIDPSHLPTSYGNFIVDPKTGSILMVVKKEDLIKIKSLLKKLDVPKKMAQIEVLLVEKKISDSKQSGINILKIGTGKKVNETSMSFDTTVRGANKGLLEFIFSRHGKGWPTFDFAMSFLMSQDDIKVNANPSVLAINQTPATIAIVEELSINNGAIQLDTVTGVTVEKSYTRAQFGITIVFTPTIHLADEEEDESKGYVSLQTNVTFDTTGSSITDRPPVTRRHIENEVRIADGETIILGGLRCHSDEDSREKIPFLGDIPGIGKLFGTTKVTESMTEMFVFITPKIINDPIEDLQAIRRKELTKRAGDIPEFLQIVEEAKQLEKRKNFEKSMKMFVDTKG